MAGDIARLVTVKYNILPIGSYCSTCGLHVHDCVCVHECIVCVHDCVCACVCTLELQRYYVLPYQYIVYCDILTYCDTLTYGKLRHRSEGGIC